MVSTLRRSNALVEGKLFCLRVAFAGAVVQHLHLFQRDEANYQPFCRTTNVKLNCNVVILLFGIAGCEHCRRNHNSASHPTTKPVGGTHRVWMQADIWDISRRHHHYELGASQMVGNRWRENQNAADNDECNCNWCLHIFWCFCFGVSCFSNNDSTAVLRHIQVSWFRLCAGQTRLSRENYFVCASLSPER